MSYNIVFAKEIPLPYPSNYLDMTATELENWFKSAKLPATPIALFEGTTITDMDKFLQSHFIPLRIAPNSPTNHTHIYRLMALKSYIEKK